MSVLSPGESWKNRKVAARWALACAIAGIVTHSLLVADYAIRSWLYGGLAGDWMVIGLYVSAIVASIVSGIAQGWLEGNVIRQLVPSFPITSWCAIYIVGYAFLFLPDAAAAPMMPGPSSAFSIGFGMGDLYVLSPLEIKTVVVLVLALMTMIVGGILAIAQAFVLHRVARGAVRWLLWSIIACFTGALVMYATVPSWDQALTLSRPDTSIAGIFVEQTRSLILDVVRALLLLLAIAKLQPRGQWLGLEDGMRATPPSAPARGRR